MIQAPKNHEAATVQQASMIMNITYVVIHRIYIYIYIIYIIYYIYYVYIIYIYNYYCKSIDPGPTVLIVTWAKLSGNNKFS